MMIFETLYESAQRGELILIEGGYCRYHLRRDGQLTVYEIISLSPGAGTKMLEKLKSVEGASSIFARCPADLPANQWYKHKGFVLEGIENLGRRINKWRLFLS